MRKLRVIHLEDNVSDILLVQEVLLNAGISFAAYRCVESSEAFSSALSEGLVDLILADWSLPSFDGLSALAMARRIQPETPFILVSGTAGEEAAIEALKAGATDYVLKSRLSKLVPAAVRAVQEAQERAQRKRVEAELRESRERAAREREVLLAREQAARADAERAGRMKDEFLAALSHELRTPLSPVLLTAQMMERRTDLSANVQKAFAMIRRNVELEARLIDDLLDFTRISRGKLALHRATVDVHQKLEHVIRICEHELRSKELELTVHPNAVDHSVLADGARLQQVLWNLLKNAIKFTLPGGQIAIRTTSGEGRIRLSVQDSGIGIEPDKLARLFAVFEQGGKDVTRQFGGLGLGLAISKGLVDAHGGSLVAQSEGRGKGSTFTLELCTVPPAPVESQEGLAAETLGAPPPEDGRLLLVEDHVDTASAISLLLRSSGYDVEVAGSVASALEAVEAESFDLVICDIGLPDGSGLDFMRQVQRRRSIEGIAVSGYGTDEDVSRSKAAGFAAHLIKPVTWLHLHEAIRRALGHSPRSLA